MADRISLRVPDIDSFVDNLNSVGYLLKKGPKTYQVLSNGSFSYSFVGLHYYIVVNLQLSVSTLFDYLQVNTYIVRPSHRKFKCCSAGVILILLSHSIDSEVIIWLSWPHLVSKDDLLHISRLMVSYSPHAL